MSSCGCTNGCNCSTTTPVGLTSFTTTPKAADCQPAANDLIIWERSVALPVGSAGEPIKMFVAKQNLVLTYLGSEVEDASITFHIRVNEEYKVAQTPETAAIKDNFYAGAVISQCVDKGQLVEIYIPDPELGSADTEPANLQIELQGYAR